MDQATAIEQPGNFSLTGSAPAAGHLRFEAYDRAGLSQCLSRCA